MFVVEFANHLVFLYSQHSAMRDGAGSRYTGGHSQQASFTKKLAGHQYRYHGLPAQLVQHGEFYAAFLDVENMLRRVALTEDNFANAEVRDLFRYACGIEKRLRVKRSSSKRCPDGWSADLIHGPNSRANSRLSQHQLCTVPHTDWQSKLYSYMDIQTVRRPHTYGKCANHGCLLSISTNSQ